jgi:hypothetical protein
VRGVLASDQLFEYRERDLAEVDGGVIETNPERGSVANHTRKANSLDEVAACNRAQSDFHCLTYDDLTAMIQNFKRRDSFIKAILDGLRQLTERGWRCGWWCNFFADAHEGPGWAVTRRPKLVT